MRLAIGVLLLLASAAPAFARSVTFGSNLEADAAKRQSAPVDSAYWNTKLASGRRVRVPRKGEVSRVRLKGRINPTGMRPPDVVLHIQVLRPVGGGKVRVSLTTGNLDLPFGGDPNHISTYDSGDFGGSLCARKGDYVALSTSGGFGEGYPDGAQFAMFGAVSGSAFKGFTGAGKDLNGSVFSGRTRPNRELLLQARVTTGTAAGVCR